ncbi:hypothetical protein LCGC14_0989440 [marine sediment metagenome]|uniref:ParB-like N-terminal domain-containing protein n=1 Tax=marine sediment metagenome TaxID=412755 RepID=A0A0F9N639_9ZZZZ
MSKEYAEIAVDLIDDPDNPLRGNIHDTELAELMQSMALYGLMHPITIYRTENRFKAVIGHRRLESARRLHWPTIPTIIQLSDTHHLREMQLHENIHRENLRPSEESNVVIELASAGNWTVTRIATAMGKSAAWVQERIEMDAWPDGLLDLVDEKKVSIGVARILMRIPDDNAVKYLANQAAHAGATIAQAQAWYQSYMTKPWQLPTPEEIEAARQSYQPPPVPKATCQGCNIVLNIDQMTSIFACPGCQNLLPALSKTAKH